ncbi:uncharacterized protein LOC128270658 [Anopheles cruzii]|uniref:uncharacterized protein LOC128270658 n=1 Tax=Anopheles cruzii TaxID=68878 RepID=UPI0022EC57C8|nr:uncharacterized protein LOC128270658 [Anopheles cruzii]
MNNDITEKNHRPEQASILDLPHENAISPILQALALQCPEITMIQLSWKEHETCAWLPLLKNFPKLQELHLVGCFATVEDGQLGRFAPFRSLSPAFRRLSVLHVAYSCITDRCFVLMYKESRITALYLKACHKITKAWLMTIPLHLPLLQKLTISNCALIFPENIEELRRIMPGLDIKYH